MAEGIITPESSIENNSLSGLALEHELLKEIPTQKSNEEISDPKTEVRIKLRMSRSINNFDSLNKQENEPEIDSLSISKEVENEEKIISNGGIIIQGDRIEELLDRNLSVLGEASLKNKSASISGDRIEFDLLNHVLTSSGNAIFDDKDLLVKGVVLHQNIDTETGEMTSPVFTLYKSIFTVAPDRTLMLNPSFLGQTSSTISEYKKNTPKDNQNHTPQGRGDADMLYFDGEAKKRLINARYTTCSTESDDWYINSKEITLNTESNKAIAENATIEFKNIPILYVPWMSFPYANQRQSGFINPTMGSTTSSGFELDIPLYWNIAPNMDATETNRYLSKRGLQLNGEFRYLLEDNKSYGVEQFQYLANDNLTHKDRYFIGAFNKEDFGNGLSMGLNYNRVSDNQYFSDLSTQILITSQVNLPQLFTVNYNKYGWQFATTIEKFQNLDLTSYTYERLPQISLNRNDDFDWVKTSLQNQYTEFKIDPLATNQAVREGSRLLSKASASFPINTAYGFIIPKVGLNYASYNLTDVNPITSQMQYGTLLDQSSSRTIPMFSLDSGLFFEKETKIGDEAYTQTLEPRLFYVYIPYQDQSKMPVFDSGLADLNMGTLFSENQYVGGDRLNNANQLSMALSSNIIDSFGRQIIGASLGERFYFTNQSVYLPGETVRNGNRSDIIGTLTANLTNSVKINTALDYNTDSGELFKGNLNMRYNPEPGKSLNLAYRYTKDTLNQVVGSTQWAIGHGYYALANLNYSILDSKAVEIITGIEYDAGCWQSRLVVQRVQTATAQANYAFFYQLVLGGMTSIGTSPLDILHRTISGYRNSSMIPDEYREEYNQ